MSNYKTDILHYFEQCRLQAYLDGGGVATVGWGNAYYSDGSMVKICDTITQEQADKEFEEDLKYFTEGVLELVNVPITDYEEAALVSLAYNIGMSNFEDSTLLKELNWGNFEGCAEQFKWWRKDNGEVVKGLCRRRISEENLFRGNTTDYIIDKLPDDWRDKYYGGK